MADAPETVNHPTLGTLRWQADATCWVARHQLPSGEMLDVQVQPTDSGNRHEFLPRAADLFGWAMKNESRMRAEAVREELLELYNEDWRQADEKRLSAKALAGRLSWRSVQVCDDDMVAIAFGYDAGELFGGHEVSVEVDGEWQFRGIDLPG